MPLGVAKPINKMFSSVSLFNESGEASSPDALAGFPGARTGSGGAGVTLTSVCSSRAMLTVFKLEYCGGDICKWCLVKVPTQKDENWVGFPEA